jgi:integrase
MTQAAMEQGIHDHLEERRTLGNLTESTLKRKKQALDWLVKANPGAGPRAFDEKRMTRTLVTMRQTRAQSTVAVDVSHIRDFWRWCQKEGLIGRFHDPLGGRKYTKGPDPEKFMLPAKKFKKLLKAARTPRDRMVLALGLYLFLRASEIKVLRIKDVKKKIKRIRTDIRKTKQKDLMPIPIELEKELKRWLKAYKAEVGELKPDYYLVPTRNLNTSTHGTDTTQFVRADEPRETLDPTQPIGAPERIVQYSLAQIGYPATVEFTDETTNEVTTEVKRQGIHILRRSGARAYFDYLREELGFDGALLRISTVLHHSGSQMTERYLDASLEKEQRNKAIAGKYLLPHLAPKPKPKKAKPKPDEAVPAAAASNVVSMMDRRIG